MQRSIVMLVIGAITGAGATAALVYTAGTDQGSPPRPAARPSPALASAGTELLGESEAALAELGAISEPSTRRATALAHIEALGFEPDAIEAIAASLPASEALNFRFDALAAQAARDPAGAIANALTLDYAVHREQALVRIARVLATLNLQAALARAAPLGDYELAAAFQSSVLATWAESDPDGALDFLETANLDLVAMDAPVLNVLADLAPERLLAIASELPARLQQPARLAAIETIAERDLGRALTLLDTIPVDPLRADASAEIVARVYARRDPAGAVAWAGTLPDADRRRALAGIASVDPLAVIEFRLDELAGLRETDTPVLSSALDALLAGPPGSHYAEIAQVFDRMVALDAANNQAQLQTALDQWIGHDTEAALAWMLADPYRLPRYLVRSAAIEIAGMGPERATQTLDRIPADQRELWMGGLAMGMAASDFRGALDWVARYAGQPGYDDAVADVLAGATGLLSQITRIQGASEPHGSAIAEFLNTSAPDLRARYARTAASEWAMVDPRAAAEWALNLDLDAADEQARIDAVGSVAAQWTAVDADAASLWALGLRAGPLRDEAVGRVIASQARGGTVDDQLLNALGSAAARQQALLASMVAIGQNDPELGRRLIDTYFTDQSLREQAEQALVMGTAFQPAGSTLTAQ